MPTANEIRINANEIHLTMIEMHRRVNPCGACFFMVANFISIVSESEHISRQSTALSFHARSAFHFGGYDMTDNILVDLSMDFSVEIVNTCDTIKGKSALTNQILRSGTSIGANIHEANYAHSRTDFISKMQLHLKNATKQNIG